MHLVEQSVLQICQETGYGCIVIDSIQVNQTLQLTLRASAYYPYQISHEEVRHAIAQGTTGYPHRLPQNLATCVDFALLKILRETGYGRLEIEFERIRKDLIGAVVREAVYRRFVFSDADVRRGLDSAI
jgi:hypothetical protein